TGGYGYLGVAFSEALRDLGAKVYVAARSKEKFQTKYNEDWSVVTGSVLGTVKGTYTTEGPGSDNCIIKFTFTELPEDFTYVSKNTEYTLEMY
ncbi:MAG: hypothetical protein J5780_03415, partial [Treponema sp.]|nr:hypothetical protein [Treponema sp.]